jgi:hypothetical protein
VLCLWCDQSVFVDFYGVDFVDWFRFYFLAMYLIFNFSVAIFLSLHLNHICSQMHIFNKLLFLRYPVIKNSSI